MVVTPPSTPPSLGSDSPIAQTPSAAFDDVFSDSHIDPNTLSDHTNLRQGDGSSHPSDVPRLRQIHATAGYREGISTSKSESLQLGFDEGYSLGATFGSRIGYLLGVLNGLTAAYRKHEVKRPAGNAEDSSSLVNESGVSTDENLRLLQMLEAARMDLSVERIFSKQYWKEDGTWCYSDAFGDGDFASFREVVDEHPLVKTWAAMVETELGKAGLKRAIDSGPE